MFSAPYSRTARVAHTVESIPPLSTTTARFVSPSGAFTGSAAGSTVVLAFLISSISSNSLGLRRPDELMRLQPQAYVEPVLEDPVRQVLRIDQAVR